MKVAIAVNGCDAGTYILMDASKEQLEFLQNLAAKLEATSTYSCMPTMSVQTNEQSFEWREALEAEQEKELYE